MQSPSRQLESKGYFVVNVTIYGRDLELPAAPLPPPNFQDADTDLAIEPPKPILPELNRAHKLAVTTFVETLGREGRPLKIMELNPGTGELTAAMAQAAPDGSDVRCIGQWESGGQDGQHDAAALPFFRENIAGLGIEWLDDDPLDFGLSITAPANFDLVVITSRATPDLVDLWLMQVKEGGALACLDNEAAKHVPGVIVRQGMAVIPKEAEKLEEAVA